MPFEVKKIFFLLLTDRNEYFLAYTSVKVIRKRSLKCEDCLLRPIIIRVPFDYNFSICLQVEKLLSFYSRRKMNSSFFLIYDILSIVQGHSAKAQKEQVP